MMVYGLGLGWWKIDGLFGYWMIISYWTERREKEPSVEVLEK